VSELGPYSAYRDSGVQWLGDIPEQWGVRRLKYLLREHDQRSEAGSEPLLSVSQYSGVTLRPMASGKDEPDTRAASLVGYKLVEPDEMVVNIMLAWNGSMGVSRFAGIASPAYCVYRFREEVDPWFFHYLLRSEAFKARIKAVSTGVMDSRLRLYTDDLYRLEAVVPPIEEQEAIVLFLDHFENHVRRFVSSTQRLFRQPDERGPALFHRGLIGEYRTRLIADVVFGRLDVRNAALALPKRTDQSDSWDAVEDSFPEPEESEA
jgi:type I restriction enzyme, S subunit